MQGTKKLLIFFTINLFILITLSLFTSFINEDELGKNLNLVEEFILGEKNIQTAEKIEQVVVERVVDGDTIILEDGRTIRYLNIDTPESVKPNTPVQCYAKEASAINRELVDKRTIYIKYDEQERDRYGRELRFIFLKAEDTSDIEKSVNAYLVEMGFARSMIYKPNDTYENDFYTLERQAKRNNIGIWRACDNPFVE